MVNIIVQLLIYALRVAGLWMLFPKCNIKSFWALVPGVSSYKLAQCADDEDSGAVWCISDTAFSLFVVLGTVTSNTIGTRSSAYLIITVIEMIVAVVNFVYSYRIYSELCHVFGRNRKWIISWLLLDHLTMFIWGISKKFQPVQQVNLQVIDDDERVVKNLEEGLTINIKERSARKLFFIKKTMLKNINLSIAPGKMVLLLGGSGAGKTTFINAVTGYEKANASIVLNGNDVYRDFEKIIYDIGVVPQQELIRETDTVFRTLMDAAALRMPANVSVSDRRKRVIEVMDIFGLTPIKNNLISKQSGGQKKRISIATEYISNPSLFILDEPDSGLDGILAMELMKKLHDISREGKIVIVVTHTPDRVIHLFDEIIVLAKDSTRTGRLVFKGPVDEAREFFEADSMEEIIRTINRPEEGGLGRADELVKKYNDMNREVIVNE